MPVCGSVSLPRGCHRSRKQGCSGGRTRNLSRAQVVVVIAGSRIDEDSRSARVGFETLLRSPQSPSRNLRDFFRLVALLMRLPPAPIAQRARGEKALTRQQLLLGRGSGLVRGGIFPGRELFAHEGQQGNRSSCELASMQRVRDSNALGEPRRAHRAAAAAPRRLRPRTASSNRRDPRSQRTRAERSQGTHRPR